MLGGVLVDVELLLQAARAVTPMAAQAAIFRTGWATFIRSPCSQGGHGRRGRVDDGSHERGTASQTGTATFLWAAGLSCSARSRPAALRKRKLPDVANPGQHRHKLLSMPGAVLGNCPLLADSVTGRDRCVLQWSAVSGRRSAASATHRVHATVHMHDLPRR